MRELSVCSKTMFHSPRLQSEGGNLGDKGGNRCCPSSPQVVLFEKPSCYHDGHSHMGSGVLKKIIVTQHSQLLHQEMQLEIVLCKDEGIYLFCAEMLLRAQSHLRWTKRQWKRVLLSDESTVYLVFGKNRHSIQRAKDEKDYPDCYQPKVQKPASVMVWGCIGAHGMGALHICECTIDAEAHVGILERHMLP